MGQDGNGRRLTLCEASIYVGVLGGLDDMNTNGLHCLDLY